MRSVEDNPQRSTVALGITYDAQGSVISITGVFDAHAAAKLVGVLPRATPEPTNVVIDFSKAREITDTGLAALLRATRGLPVRLRARGLSERHHRMLKLLSSAETGAAGRQ